MGSTLARAVLAGTALVEGVAALARFKDRRLGFALAARLAVEEHRRLVVVGDPDGGAHTRLARAYGCGDLCVDLTGCPTCPHAVAVDLTRGRVAEVADDTAVVFASCVLEYVSDPLAAWRELVRMAGSPARVITVSVQPIASATGALYPGAKWQVARTRDGGVEFTPVSGLAKVAAAGGLAWTAFAAFRPAGG